MSTAVQNILEQAMRLTPSERVELADNLTADLSESFGSEQDQAILELLEQRRADYLAGRASSAPGNLRTLGAPSTVSA